MSPLRFLPALLALAALPAAAQTRSVYTTLDPNVCETTAQDLDEGWTEQTCPGTAGYTLYLHEDDLRQDIDIVAPGGIISPLALGAFVSDAFSSVGPRAEWRVLNRRPVALIVRLNASEDVDNPDRTVSRLAVARISPRESCLVAVVQPAADMNAQARRLADRSARMPCIGIR